MNGIANAATGDGQADPGAFGDRLERCLGVRYRRPYMGKAKYRGILVKLRSRLPIGLVWLVTVLAVWLVTTALLAVLIKAAADWTSAGALISQSLVSAAFASVVVGGPATAVALRVRRDCRLGKAAFSGLGTAVLILLFLWSYLEASGTSIADAWSAVAPVLVVAMAEMALAFTLRGPRVLASGPGPGTD